MKNDLSIGYLDVKETVVDSYSVIDLVQVPKKRDYFGHRPTYPPSEEGLDETDYFKFRSSLNEEEREAETAMTPGEVAAKGGQPEEAEKGEGQQKEVEGVEEGEGMPEELEDPEQQIDPPEETKPEET